ncbi:MAG: hypothetical protein Q4D89_12160 [Arachnia propionica]|uniref:hypothetical protein n=1 Tax=Arachnia propionica TaxID=1750 RepID=UPI002705FC72|nr:hypothetical protein [Arachnia propionica]
MGYERLMNAKNHMDKRRFREAIVDLQAILDEEPRPSEIEETKELLALANYKAAYLPKAERLARELIESNPTNTYAHTILVRSLERQSRKEEAAKARTLALALGADL